MLRSRLGSILIECLKSSDSEAQANQRGPTIGAVRSSVGVGVGVGGNSSDAIGTDDETLSDRLFRPVRRSSAGRIENTNRLEAREN